MSKDVSLAYVDDTDNSNQVFHESDILNLYESFIGGNAVVNSVELQNFIESYTCERCKNCYHFIGQIYAPLEKINIEFRIFYLFICFTRECQKIGDSFRVLRFQEKNMQYSQIADHKVEILRQKNLSSWSMDVDDDDSNNNWNVPPSSGEKIENTELSKILIIPGLFEKFSLAFTDDSKNYEKSNLDLLQKINEEDRNTLASVINSKKEVSSPSYFDESCFETWLQICNEEKDFLDDDEKWDGQLANYIIEHPHRELEIVRYSFGGLPIFKDTPIKELKKNLKCKRCGSKLIFEFELFSTINNWLKFKPENLTVATQELKTDISNSQILLGVEWPIDISNVIIFTCSKSCMPSNRVFVDELILVQLENETSYMVNDTIAFDTSKNP